MLSKYSQRPADMTLLLFPVAIVLFLYHSFKARLKKSIKPADEVAG